jgi:hypothetical protein
LLVAEAKALGRYDTMTARNNMLAMKGNYEHMNNISGAANGMSGGGFDHGLHCIS